MGLETFRVTEPQGHHHHGVKVNCEESQLPLCGNCWYVNLIDVGSCILCGFPSLRGLHTLRWSEPHTPLYDYITHPQDPLWMSGFLSPSRHLYSICNRLLLHSIISECQRFSYDEISNLRFSICTFSCFTSREATQHHLSFMQSLHSLCQSWTF